MGGRSPHPSVRAAQWDPAAETAAEGTAEGAAEDALRVDARPAFGVPVAVEASRSEMRRLIARLRSEGRAKQISVSNEAFRKCKAVTVDDDTPQDEFETFCGSVLVFYCARHVLDGIGIPCVARS